tara:strand:+ start:117 stop:374 length:258 start_codon:yes stop_codon:yes gene_type:complete
MSDTIKKLQDVIPSMDLNYIASQLITATQKYQYIQSPDNALSLKTILTAMELKLIHNHNADNYNKVVKENIEAIEVLEQIRQITE